MSGSLINGAAPSASPGNAPELSDPMLQQIQDEIERNLSVDPENKQAYNKIVVAGMHLGLDKGPQGLLAQLRNVRDPIAEAAKGAVSLVLVMRREAKGVMPLKAAVPAAMTLMLKALDFLDSSGAVKIGKPELERASHIFGDFIFARFGISRQGLATAAQRVHQLVQDPNAVQAMKIKVGMIPHPGAATAGMIPHPNAATGAAPAAAPNA